MAGDAIPYEANPSACDIAAWNMSAVILAPGVVAADVGLEFGVVASLLP